MEADKAEPTDVGDTAKLAQEETLEVADPVSSANPVGTEALPPVVSYSSISMNELPCLFDTTDDQNPNKRLKLSSNNLFSAINTNGHEASAAVDTVETTTTEVEGFSVFDTSFDEQAFVSALLDSNDNSLSVLS